MKALSICIPTYKRSHELMELLGEIEYQRKSLPIEVCVSINGISEDMNYINAIFDFKRVRFHIFKNNEGPDKNIQTVLRMGQGRHLWMIGDKDHLAKGALRKMLRFLKEQRLIYASVNKDGQNGIENESIIYDTCGYISCIVLRKSFYQKHNRMEKYYGTWNAHVLMLREMALKNPDLRASWTPFIAINLGKSSRPGIILKRDLGYKLHQVMEFWLFWLENFSSKDFNRIRLKFTWKAIKNTGVPLMVIKDWISFKLKGLCSQTQSCSQSQISAPKVKRWIK